MKDLFTNLYNKVFSFFHQAEKKEASKSVACNRLKLVLMQDRTNLSPAIMERMRKELIDLLSKYLELDRELLELNFEQEDEQMALMLSIPVIRAKDEEEIQEILRKEDEIKQEEDEEENKEEETEDEKTSDSEDSENSEDDEVDEISDENEDITEASEEDTSHEEPNEEDKSKAEDKKETIKN